MVSLSQIWVHPRHSRPLNHAARVATRAALYALLYETLHLCGTARSLNLKVTFSATLLCEGITLYRSLRECEVTIQQLRQALQKRSTPSPKRSTPRTERPTPKYGDPLLHLLYSHKLISGGLLVRQRGEELVKVCRFMERALKAVDLPPSEEPPAARILEAVSIVRKALAYQTNEREPVDLLHHLQEASGTPVNLRKPTGRLLWGAPRRVSPTPPKQSGLITRIKGILVNEGLLNKGAGDKDTWRRTEEICQGMGELVDLVKKTPSKTVEFIEDLAVVETGTDQSLFQLVRKGEAKITATPHGKVRDAVAQGSAVTTPVYRGAKPE